MARATSDVIYYQKAFSNSKRCLEEAKKQIHPAKNSVIRLKNPRTKGYEEVMETERAIEWCIENHLPNWAQGTWRMHRCGYRLLINSLIKSERMTTTKGQELIDRMLSASGLKKKDRVKKTSAKRKKVIKPEHIQEIADYCKSKGSKWGDALVIWLKASVSTGLRPNEWRTAEIFEKDGRIILKSENFKHNKDKSYAPFREIDITSLGGDSIKIIRQHISIVKGMMKEGIIEKYVEGCSMLLYNVNVRLWPRRKANITLYTGRHQFSANGKADKLVSDVERAALMGHKTTATSRERYGKARSGSSGLTPNVADESVLKQIIDKPLKRNISRKNSRGNE